MNKIIFTGIMALTGLLTACSTPVDLDAPRSTAPSGTSSLFSQSEFRCDADPAQVLIGTTYNSNTDQEARTLSGSKLVRTLRPGQVITMEYNPERVNLRLDDNEIITTVGCG